MFEDVSKRCRNTKCSYHARQGNGCKLLEGLNFVRCRQAVI